MAWEKGSFGKAELEEHLGLTGGDSTYSEGSSTGVKSNDLLGEGYLSESDYKRLLGNKDLKKSFVASGGDPDSWETINDVDSAIDYLTKEKEESVQKPSFVVGPNKKGMSPKYAEAKARVAQWEEDVLSGRSSKDVYGTSPDDTSFLERFRSKLGKRLENGNYLSPELDDVDIKTEEKEPVE